MPELIGDKVIKQAVDAFGPDAERVLWEMPDPEELLRDPEQTRLPLKPSILFAVCSALAVHATPDQDEVVIRIARRLQAEVSEDFGVFLIVGFLRAHPEARTRQAFQEFLSSDLGRQVASRL